MEYNGPYWNWTIVLSYDQELKKFGWHRHGECLVLSSLTLKLT